MPALPSSHTSGGGASRLPVRILALLVTSIAASPGAAQSLSPAAKPAVVESVSSHDITAETAGTAEDEWAFHAAVAQHLRGDPRTALEQLERQPVVGAAVPFYRGLLLMELDRPAEAAHEFALALEHDDAPDDIWLHLGQARLLAGEDVAAEESLSAYLARRPNDADAHLWLGVALHRQGRTADAETHFAAAGVPETTRTEIRGVSHRDEIAANLNDGFTVYSDAGVVVGTPYGCPTYGNACTSGCCCAGDCSGCCCAMDDAGQRPLRLTVLLGNEYDSNLASLPDFDGLGAVADKGDSRFFFATFGDWLLVDDPLWNAGLLGSTLSSFHYNQTNFDLDDFMGGAYINALALENVLAGLRYEYHHTLLDYQTLSNNHRLTPNVSWLQGDFGHTTAYYEYSTASLTAPALIPAQVQSADVHTYGVTQALNLRLDVDRMFVGYFYQTADAVGADFDRHTDMVTARYERRLGAGWFADAEVRHFWDDYLNPNSLDFFDRPREDTRVEFRTGVQAPLSRLATLRLDYTYIATNSNVANLFGVNFYEYDRHLIASQLIFDF